VGRSSDGAIIPAGLLFGQGFRAPHCRAVLAACTLGKRGRRAVIALHCGDVNDGLCWSQQDIASYLSFPYRAKLMPWEVGFERMTGCEPLSRLKDSAHLQITDCTVPERGVGVFASEKSRRWRSFTDCVPGASVAHYWRRFATSKEGAPLSLTTRIGKNVCVAPCLTSGGLLGAILQEATRAPARTTPV